MSLSMRKVKIINMLLLSDDFMAVEDIAKRLDVSCKTARNDIASINDQLKSETNICITSKPGWGVRLQFQPDDRELLDRLLAELDCDNGQEHLYKRNSYIISKLLCTNEKSITIQDLANELYVSRTSVMKALEDVERWFDKFGIKMDRRKHCGVEIRYDEISYRKTLWEFYELLKKRENFLKGQ